jgi:hypothetical protein
MSDSVETYRFGIDFKDLISEGVNDIRNNIEEWIKFTTDTGEEDLSFRSWDIKHDLQVASIYLE